MKYWRRFAALAIQLQFGQSSWSVPALTIVRWVLTSEPTTPSSRPWEADGTFGAYTSAIARPAANQQTRGTKRALPSRVSRSRTRHLTRLPSRNEWQATRNRWISAEIGFAAILAAAAVMLGIYFLFARTAQKDLKNTTSTIARLQGGILSQQSLISDIRSCAKNTAPMMPCLDRLEKAL